MTCICKAEEVWQGMLGQETAINILTKMCSENRLPHALLFKGRVGVGKGRAAVCLARWLLQIDEPVAKFLLRWQAEEELHPDLHILRAGGAQGKIKVGEIKNLQDQLSLTPVRANCKVVILEAAERLGPEAANALLKILEEPQMPVYFILLSAHPEMVLSTIRSRCIEIRFIPLAENAVEYILEKHAVPPKDIAVSRILAAGSAGEALYLATHNINDIWREVEDVFVRAFSISDQEIMSLATLCQERKQEERYLLKIWLECYQYLLYAAFKYQAQGIVLPMIDEKLLASWSLSRVELTSDILNVLEKRLQSNASVKLLFEQALLKIRQLSL